MRKNILTAFILLLANLANAQIAQWIIPPQYDSIYFANGANLIVTDSMNTKIFWNINGKRLFATTENIHPFAEGYAVTTNDFNNITGFYDTKGVFTPLFQKTEVKTANNYPYFSNGYLIIKRNDYYVLDTKGNVDNKKYLMAYPFRNGYAVCHDYENPQKQKGTANYLINRNKKEVPLTYNGKTYNSSDVDFISSVNDEHIGIVIIKRNLYYFEGEGKELKPLGFPNPKNKGKIIQAKFEGDLPLIFDTPNPVIYAKSGKSDQITICFDSNLVPTEISFNNKKHRYPQHPPKTETLTSPMQTIEKNGLFGLSLNLEEIIPPQFEAINCCFNNNAFVKTSGKHGMIQNIENATFTIKINNGSSIPFRHQTYETTIKIDMSPLLSPYKVDIKTDALSGYDIDKISKVSTTTENGNRAEYSCTLTIPASIESTSSDYIYPIRIIYDGISILPIQQKVQAWRYNYFNVSIKKDEMTIDKDNQLLTFPYVINIEQRFSESDPYPMEVEIVPDTLFAKITKITDTQGLCSMPVSQLKEGENLVYIRLVEQGCPPIDFPFSFTYTKPSPKTKRKPVVKVKEPDYNLKFDL